MKNRYSSLRNIAYSKKNHANFKYFILAAIFRWAKDETLGLKEFAFLTKKGLEYIKNHNNAET